MKRNRWPERWVKPAGRLARAAAFLLLLPAVAAAQLLPEPAMPPLPQFPTVGEVARGVADTVDNAAALPRAVATLAQNRIARIDTLVRAHPGVIARDDHGDAARADEVVVADPDDALIAAARAAGFALIERATIEGLDIGYARFRSPRGKSLAAAIKAMRRIAGTRDVSADQLHFQSGGASAPAPAPGPEGPASDARIGMIDGGVSMSAGLGGAVFRAGFAHGAGSGSGHGTSVASLMLGTRAIRGAAAGARLWAADVYGDDPAGGSALAIARALGWLATERVPVTVISLVGPANPVLARVVRAVQARGMIVVAAVGNDGPAAPPSYPASYPGVVAVTGVDGRNRALIEAGRALHLDYAAPGADMAASDASGRAVPVRGTSFAAPLVAATIARAYPTLAPGRVAGVMQALDRAAIDLGQHGPDKRYGRGLICGNCRTPLK